MIVLASASPRRRELFGLIGYSFEVRVSSADESIASGLSRKEAVEILAKRKAEAVFAERPDDIVIGADTIVVADDRILGKPVDEDDAKRMLRSLSGRKHWVYTGVNILSKERSESFVSATEVEFYPLSDEMISTYVSTREPMDKAGAYGIQGRGAVLVKGISGDYYTVVGLPVAELAHRLCGFGVQPLQSFKTSTDS